MKNQRSSRAKQWDRKARAFGFRDERDWRHQLRVRRLRELLRRMPIRPDSYMFRSIIAIKGYLPAHPDLFTVREVADAIGASAKVIRKAARGGMIKFRRLPGQNARKLFFELAAVRQFKDRFRPGDNLRSEKIALNPHFRQGDAVTIDRAMVELGLSRRGVQYYLSQGVLKKSHVDTEQSSLRRKASPASHGGGWLSPSDSSTPPKRGWKKSPASGPRKKSQKKCLAGHVAQ
jgi:hypothetical protein